MSTSEWEFIAVATVSHVTAAQSYAARTVTISDRKKNKKICNFLSLRAARVACRGARAVSYDSRIYFSTLQELSNAAKLFTFRGI